MIPKILAVFRLVMMSFFFLAVSRNVQGKEIDFLVQNAAKAADYATTAADHANGTAQNAAQSGTKADKSASGAAQASDTLKKSVSRQAAPRRSKAKNPPIDDFVPCMFDGDEEFQLRTMASPARDPNAPLDDQEAQTIQDSITSLAAAEVGKSKYKDLLTGQLVNFTQAVAQTRWSGLVPGDVAEKAKSLAVTAGLVAQAEPIGNTIKKEVELITNPNSTFDRPNDVSCSFSVMDWHETSDNFGRRVANDYVGIQVNIRNLNQKNEFLIHDVQIAVDTGLSPYQFGRFQAGRDKLIVRNVAQRGQSEDRRNLIVNTLQMVGAIAGGASAAQTEANPSSVTTQKLSTAVAIFQGAFITGLTNIFPDHTLEHINHINDLAFSASSTSKTVVPIQGSVPLTTFLTEKPLEQLPFAHCGRAVRERAWYDPHHNRDSGTTNDSNGSDDPGSANFDFCRADYDQHVIQSGTNFDKSSQVPLQPSAFSKPLPYKRWEPAALRIFQRRVFVVIAGVHIQELSSGSVVDKLSCPIMGDGSIDLSRTDSSGSVSCTLNGSHLDKVVSIKLQQAATSNIAGTIQPASDGNSATITFKAPDFNGVTGKYQLILTDGTGKDLDSKQLLTFNLRSPKIVAVVVTPLGKDLVASMVGTNLDRISSVSLSDDAADGGKTITGTIQHQGSISAADGTLSVTFAAGDLQNLKPAPTNKRHLAFTTLDDQKGATATQVTDSVVIFQ